MDFDLRKTHKNEITFTSLPAAVMKDIEVALYKATNTGLSSVNSGLSKFS
jgi:hypothetical protein